MGKNRLFKASLIGSVEVAIDKPSVEPYAGKSIVRTTRSPSGEPIPWKIRSSTTAPKSSRVRSMCWCKLVREILRTFPTNRCNEPPS